MKKRNQEKRDMKNRAETKRAAWLALSAVLSLGAMLSFAPAMAVYAASKKPITSISLSIDAEIMPETDIGSEDIEIESKNEKYSIDGYTVSNSGSVWEADMVPEIQVTLKAQENFYFKSIPKSKIGLRGDGEITKGSIKDSSSTMVLTVQIPMSVPDIEEVKLSDEGIASWKAVAKAGKYELLFYKNGTATVTPVVTNTNSYNCRERFGKTNANTSYSIKVRAVNVQDETKKGRWTESNSIYVSKEKARNFRQYPDGGNGSWKQTEDGRYRYERADGTYAAGGWEELSGLWYFFDAEGFMKTGWIDWEGKSYYCLETGEMLKNANTPDGAHVGEDGAKIEKSAVTGTEAEEDPDEAMRKEWNKLQGKDSEEDEDSDSDDE